MRVRSPDLLKMDREALLRDVRERLAERAPQLAESLDRAHPAWLVLEEAAWMVESLSAQLDDWPWAVLQQFAHLLGAELAPAVPAVGVVVVGASGSGRLSWAENPTRWRFLTRQTEDRPLVEFVLAEDHAPVVQGRIASCSRLRGGELVLAAGPPRDATLPDHWRSVHEGERSTAFAEESFRYSVVGADATRLEADLNEAVTRFQAERPVGWLRFEVRRLDAQNAQLVASIDPANAFGPDAGEPGDAVAVWATLDDSTWTPPVRIANHPLLPPRLRGTRPLPTESGLLVPDVPANLSRRELLVRDARPAPADLPLQLWRTLTHLVASLAPLRPRLVRQVVLSDKEPAWVEAAIRTGAWYRVTGGADLTFAHVTLTPSEAGCPLRFAIAGPAGRAVRVHPIDPTHGLLVDELTLTSPWSLSLPGPAGRTVTAEAWQVDVPANVQELLLLVGGPSPDDVVLLNPVLVVNAPLVRDGREVGVTRAVPEPVSLVQKDIVTAGVVERLAASGLDPSASRVLRRMALARLRLGDEQVEGWDGVAVDAPEGQITLNSPDERGVVREVRRGETVGLEWYRRTQASLGNVAAGEIRLVEQTPTANPRLLGATNPLPTAWGADRERDEDAVARVFGPVIGVPVTPGDWERLVRAALGRRAADWVIRVWGYSERTLVSTELWPLRTTREADPARDALAEVLAGAGPEVLLVVAGPEVGALSEVDAQHAKSVVEALVSRWRERVPTVHRAVFAPLVPLTLLGQAEGPFPRFALAGASGELTDARGRRARVPAVAALLNAAIVSVAT